MYWMSLALICIGAAADLNVNKLGPPAYSDYHRDIGIPKAARIKEAETKIIEGAADGINPRIRGGFPTIHQRYPWMVGLLISWDEFYETPSMCGGSLLDLRRVLTAAHCIYRRKYIQVVLGSDYLYYGGLRTNRSYFPKTVVHPSYSGSNINSFDTGIDAGIVFIPNLFSFEWKIKPVALPTGKMRYGYFTGYSAHAAGYGSINDTHFNKGNLEVEVEVQADSACTVKKHPDWWLCTSENMIEGKVSTCVAGDSGGPLTVTICGKNILIGIMLLTREKCENGGSSYHTRVADILDFISDNVEPH